MKKLVTTRQLILMLFISLLTIKVLYLPSLLAKDIGRDYYFYGLVMLLFDFFVLLIFLYLFNKNPDLSFYQILCKIFGKIISKVLIFLFFIFFILKCWVIFQTNFSYLNENLYTSLTWYKFAIPIFITIMFTSQFGIKSLARIVEIFVPIVLIGFLFSLCIGITRADYTNLLPFMEKGFFSSVPTIFKFSFWFGDYIIFIVFFGNVKDDKHFNIKISISLLVGLILVAFFFATSFSLFSYSSIAHTNSISDITQVLPSTSDSGSFDWILIVVWDISLFLSFILNALGSFYCFRQTIFKKNHLLIISIILALILVASLVTHFDIYITIQFLQNYACYFCFFVEYILPLFLLIFSFKIKKQKRKSFSKQNFIGIIKNKFIIDSIKKQKKLLKNKNKKKIIILNEKVLKLKNNKNINKLYVNNAKKFIKNLKIANKKMSKLSSKLKSLFLVKDGNKND